MAKEGFTLHAATRAGAGDPEGKEALVQYVLRPPHADKHVQRGPEGLVRVVLKRPYSDGTTAIDMDPLSLIARLTRGFREGPSSGTPQGRRRGWSGARRPHGLEGDVRPERPPGALKSG